MQTVPQFRMAGPAEESLPRNWPRGQDHARKPLDVITSPTLKRKEERPCTLTLLTRRRRQ
jgi:hypothetical protein